jgi:hypothetical protein
MHDLDRAMFETGTAGGFGAGESSSYEQQEFLEVLGEVVRDGGGRTQDAWEQSGESEFAGEYDSRSGRQGESGQLEMALELLEVGSEAELDRFLGDLVSRAAGAARDFGRSSAGQALKGIVKNAVGQALPVVGRAVGNWVAPGYGDFGARAGGAAGALLGLELEGLSQEDRELETAQALVQWATEAVRRAAAMSPQTPPDRLARAAAVSAAQRIAPGLAAVVSRIPVPGQGPAAATPATPRSSTGTTSGRWVRRGNTVVLHGF